MSRKIQGVHQILIGPVGQFQSVYKGVRTVQRGSQDADTHKNATLAEGSGSIPGSMIF